MSPGFSQYIRSRELPEVGQSVSRGAVAGIVSGLRFAARPLPARGRDTVSSTGDHAFSLTPRDMTAAMPTSIGRDEVQRLVAEEVAQVVEVLPAAEYEDEHIAGAISIPLKELDEQAPRLLDRGRPMIVYCYDHQ